VRHTKKSITLDGFWYLAYKAGADKSAGWSMVGATSTPIPILK